MDELHGVEVADPFRWLEDMESDEVLAWARAQDKLARSCCAAIPARDRLASRLRSVQSFPQYGAPFKKGGRLFYTQREVEEPTGILYMQEGADGEPKAVIDPSAESPDGSIGIGIMSVSETGRRIAYSLIGSGAWHTVRIRDVDANTDMPERLVGIRGGGGVAWTHDDAGFYYVAFDAPAEGQELQTGLDNCRVMYHRVGTSQDDDQVIYQRTDHPDWLYGRLRVTEDGRYLVFSNGAGADPNTGILYVDLENREAGVVELLDNTRAAFTFESNDGSEFWVQTDLDAPRGRLVAIDIANAADEHWREIIPQQKGTLTGVSIIGGRLFCTYLEDVRRHVRIFDFQGTQVDEITLPDISGSVGGFTDRRDDPETFYSFSSLVDPGTIYRYDVRTGESEVFRRANTLTWKPEDYVTSQVFFESGDGTRVPMFITHRKGIELNGENRVLMYGYGAYQWAAFPWYQAMRIVWLEEGGVFALPGIRGGGEYGSEWHEAGMLTRKQNTFDDFIAACEWLIDNGYTSPSRLAIQGGSASGMLPGVVACQRPDLVGACIVNYPTVDLIRGPRFTGGDARVPEFGGPDDPDQCRAILDWCPLRNAKPGVEYPAMLICTGGRDDVAVPMHAYKMAATFQHAQAGDAPILLRVGWEDGHYPSGIEDNLELWADQLAFLMRELN